MVEFEWDVVVSVVLVGVCGLWGVCWEWGVGSGLVVLFFWVLGWVFGLVVVVYVCWDLWCFLFCVVWEIGGLGGFLFWGLFVVFLCCVWW